jgi:peptidoglycan/LPS O-acetylase OafA/YrhL
MAARSDPHLQEDALDGLRGVAALLVVLSHLSHAGMQPIPGLDFAGIGKPGVYLFFVLSAFLLTRQVLSRDAAALADRGLWLRYFARRFLRIYPLFGFVLVTSYLMGRCSGVALPFAISGRELLAHLTLRDGKDVLWSIPPEFAYYFVLPLVGAACVLLERRVRWVLLAVAPAIALATHLWPPSLAVASSHSLGPYLPVFLLGSAAALVHRRVAASAGGRRWLFEGSAIACAVAVVLTIPSLFAAVSGRPVASDHFHGALVFYGVVWSAFLIGTLLGAGGCRAALSLPAVRYLGFISFSVYLWHMAVIRVVASHSPLASMGNAWLALAAIVAISSVSWLAIERPFQRLSARGRWRRPG